MLLSPSEEADLSAYRDAVLLESPASGLNVPERLKLYENGDGMLGRQLCGMDLSREAMVALFTALRAADGMRAADFAEISKASEFQAFSPEFTVFALAVFEELGLWRLQGGRIALCRGQKTELTRSKIYCAALKIVGTEGTWNRS